METMLLPNQATKMVTYISTKRNIRLEFMKNKEIKGLEEKIVTIEEIKPEKN